MKITHDFVLQVRELYERGYSPIDVARSMATQLDSVLYVINNLLI